MNFPIDLPQDITYWAFVSEDEFGSITFAAPVVIKGRWEDTVRLFTDLRGSEFRSLAIIYLESDVAVEGWLFEGKSTVADPRTVDRAREIKLFRKIPDVDADEFERRAIL